MRILLVVFAMMLASDAASAQSVSVGPGGVRVDDGYRGDGGYYRQRRRRPQVDCASLRQACMMKEQLGEQGQGNCRTYRAYCR